MLFADLKVFCYITHEENFDSIFELGVLSRQKINQQKITPTK